MIRSSPYIGNAHKHHVNPKSALSTVTPYSSRYASQQEMSKFVIPTEGAPADAVHQMLKDELDMDGRPNLNCRTLFSILRPLLLCSHEEASN